MEENYLPIETGSRPPFVRTTADRVFALVFLVLGYLYIEYVFSRLFGYGREWRICVFTLLYAAATLCYFSLKELRPGKYSWFWLGCLLVLGLSFTLFENRSLMELDVLALHALALYWPLSAAGCGLRGGVSSLLPYDLLNAAVIVPYGNFAAIFRCIFGGWRREKEDRKPLWPVLLGITLLVLILATVLPLLSRADAQFGSLLESLFTLPRDILFDPEIILAIPVACVLFGLCYGLANRRHTEHIKAEGIAQLGKNSRVVPNTTLYIALGGVCLVYALFIALQAGQLFSAFFGRLSGTDIYSRFAREGFFELCRVAAINGFLLLCANLFSSTPRSRSRALRVFNILMAALTLLILASAASKMLLYISVYGLTPKRVLTLAFMLMLAVLFSGVIPWQKRDFNLIRLAVCFAAVLFCLLALCGLDRLIETFNLAHGFDPAGF